MRTAAIVPAYQAAESIGAVAAALVAAWSDSTFDGPVIVVDDGSTDDTAVRAAAAGARVVRHPRNRGKGVALRTGLAQALHLGASHAVTLDADGQHPAAEAVRLASWVAPDDALVLGVRDLPGAGAPRANQRSNQISNYWLSRFAGRPLADTQCGLRRYPIRAALDLGGQAQGFGYEAEVLLLASRAGLPLVEVPIQVFYPPAAERQTHFHVVRDPLRIVLRVVATLARPPRSHGTPTPTPQRRPAGEP